MRKHVYLEQYVDTTLVPWLAELYESFEFDRERNPYAAAACHLIERIAEHIIFESMEEDHTQESNPKVIPFRRK